MNITISQSISIPARRWSIARSGEVTSAIGFSLLEVVVALGIATFGIVAIMGLFSIGLTSSKQSNDTTELAAMALQVAGALRASTNTALDGTNFYFDACGTPTNRAAAYYQCQLSVTNNVLPGEILTTNFIAAAMKFSWPVSVAMGVRSTNTLFTSAPYRP